MGILLEAAEGLAKAVAEHVRLREEIAPLASKTTPEMVQEAASKGMLSGFEHSSPGNRPFIISGLTPPQAKPGDPTGPERVHSFLAFKKAMDTGDISAAKTLIKSTGTSLGDKFQEHQAKFIYTHAKASGENPTSAYLRSLGHDSVSFTGGQTFKLSSSKVGQVISDVVKEQKEAKYANSAIGTLAAMNARGAYIDPLEKMGLSIGRELNQAEMLREVPKVNESRIDRYFKATFEANAKRFINKPELGIVVDRHSIASRLEDAFPGVRHESVTRQQLYDLIDKLTPSGAKLTQVEKDRLVNATFIDSTLIRRWYRESGHTADIRDLMRRLTPEM